MTTGFMRLISVFAFILALQNVAAESPAPGQSETPLEVVSSTVDRVIQTLRDTAIDGVAKKQIVATIVGEHFDFTAMSSRVMATNWTKANQGQRAKFTALFQELLSNTYWRKISGYKDETVEYLSENVRENKLATVRTMIHTATVDIPVDYKLYRRDDTWYAYDVVVEQISLVRNYRGSFQTIVRDKGINGLLKQLEEKVVASRNTAD